MPSRNVLEFAEGHFSGHCESTSYLPVIFMKDSRYLPEIETGGKKNKKKSKKRKPLFIRNDYKIKT